MFAGNEHVDRVRIKMCNILRAYAQKDAELGYTQGMCYPAAVMCLLEKTEEEAQESFEALVRQLRTLWLGRHEFPMLKDYIPKFSELLQQYDPELADHLDPLVPNLWAILPSAWLSCFAKWLPVRALLDVVPFIVSVGRSGLLTVTLVMFLHYRWFLA